MACYLVSFELGDEQVREALVTQLKTYSGYCPINKTCWAITTDKKAVEIREHLTSILGSGDRLFVVRSGSEGAWRNSYGTENDQWLKKNL